MPNQKENFFNSLHFEANKKSSQESIPQEPYTMCLKLMEASAKISNFLDSFPLKDAQNSNSGIMDSGSIKIQPTQASNFYRILNMELGEIEYSLRENKINENEFNHKLKELFQRYKVDPKNLLDIRDKIHLSERDPNPDQKLQLSEQLQSQIKKYYEDIRQEHTNDPSL